jgi:signal transduction histidine kinase
MTCFRFIYLFLLLSAMGRALGDLESTAIGVFVDGAENPLYGPRITVPHDTASLRFFVNPKVPRVRYRLASLESKWRARTDEMLFKIRFLKKNGDLISQEVFPAVGTSSGWKGSIEKSVFTSRREMVTVPQGANVFSVVISTAGPPTLVGVFAVTGITIQSKGQGAAMGITYMRDSRVPDSRGMTWGKSGTHPTMATALHLDAGDEKSPVFIINDDDIKAHADWITGIRGMPIVVPGETLELQWNELYCAGMGGAFSQVYERLPAGVHRFEVEDLSLTGVPLGAITTVSVKVPRPYWQTIWFWAACLSVIAILSTLGGRYLIRKKIARHLEQAQLISDERLRIARDLHDDLGTRLSHISLLSAFAESHSTDSKTGSSLGEISTMSRELISALSETVWMLNSKNNELEALVDFLCRLVSELCRLSEIRCRIDALSVVENVPISHEFRHNVSLAVKEIVNNALKHSFATEIKMSIQVEGKLLKITVADNGVGLTREPGKTSLGLANITQRMETIRGKCDITPIENEGLKVSLEAPIT